MTAMSIEIPREFDGIQHRTAEIEAFDPDEGTLLCRVVPYDVEVALTRVLWESFAPKAFERAASAPTRCKMWHLHDGPLIGHAREVEDRPDGVWVRAKFSDTLNGQEARELARDGTLDQVSVTFNPMREWMKVTRRDDGLHVRHARGALLGFALVPHGAYDTAAYVASVRSDDADKIRDEKLALLQSFTH